MLNSLMISNSLHLMNLGTEPPELIRFSREHVNHLITFNFDF